MTRVFNFSAGPAMLPESVLRQAADEMLDWRGSGMSVMEVSHRSKAFIAVAHEAEADLRALLAIPSNYRVLFLQGGATGQFSAIPLNLATQDSTVDYVNTGAWSKKAIGEAKRYAKVNVAADEAAGNYSSVPAQGALRPTPGAAYLHYTPNETIGGVEFPYVPVHGDVPLVADFSSTILSRPIDVSKFGLIYAGAQKNIGPSGLVVVIVRDDLLGRACRVRRSCGTMRRWRRRARCSTRRRPSAGTSRASCSSGCWGRAGSRRWPSATAPRPSACTRRSTARATTATRLRRKRVPG